MNQEVIPHSSPETRTVVTQVKQQKTAMNNATAKPNDRQSDRRLSSGAFGIRRIDRCGIGIKIARHNGCERVGIVVTGRLGDGIGDGWYIDWRG